MVTTRVIFIVNGVSIDGICNNNSMYFTQMDVGYNAVRSVSVSTPIKLRPKSSMTAGKKLGTLALRFPYNGDSEATSVPLYDVYDDVVKPVSDEPASFSRTCYLVFDMTTACKSDFEMIVFDVCVV